MQYKFLGNTGVLVSELCFGAMTFGGEGFWGNIGKQQQDEANELVKTAHENGINFYDTANVYSFGKSEQILGQAFRDLGISRNEIFLATKVRGRMSDKLNDIGLSKYHILASVDESLQRLGMDHIDLLYIHGVDAYTPLEETMRALEDTVRSGKVRYLGVSNHAAWQIMKANGFADRMGWNRFVATQLYYTIASRELERELIPMIKDQRLALMPWSPLAGGFLTGKYRRDHTSDGDRRRDAFDFPPIDKEKAYNIIDVMDEIAKEYEVSVAQVAIAWLLHQPAVTSVIIGAKRKDQLLDNIESVTLKMSREALARLDKVSALNPEYPQWMIERQGAGRVPER
ncbi:MAG: aldo/keto reductase [Lewinellaceae bacterium]|nr:aldo/keto reductase [Saprospiraceae bacterium]MCB9341562.1 aldo/keto reductase [Lewinellaceae bacterium]